jgi:hypothetical protein
MIFTKALKYEDVVEKLEKERDVITIIGCETCARVSGVSNDKNIAFLAKRLSEDGYRIEGGYLVPSACSPVVLFAKLNSKINTIISFTCGTGVCNLSRTFENMKVVPASEDIGLMIEDSAKHILKVTLPYAGHEDEYGKEYAVFTGEKTKQNNNLSFGGLDK